MRVHTQFQKICIYARCCVIQQIVFVHDVFHETIQNPGVSPFFISSCGIFFFFAPYLFAMMLILFVVETEAIF